MNRKRPLVAITHGLFQDSEVEQAILAPLGADVILHTCRTEDELIALGEQMDALVMSLAPITRRVVGQLPHCQVIVKAGVGVDSIDIVAATEYGIPVANVPDYGTDEVATHAMALLLSCVRRIVDGVTLVRNGRWMTTPPFSIQRSQGKVLGIIGFGRIGRSVAQKAQGFGWRILYHDPKVDSGAIANVGIEYSDLDTLLREADFVTLHVPLTPTTYHMIGQAELAKMKPTALLINTARGGVVNADALYQALEQNQIAGAAVDVLEAEPPPPDHPLLNHPRMLVTSHVAWYSQQALEDLRVKSVQEVARVLRGELPQNLLNLNVQPRFALHT
jgi:D-3-phosphoglycerate dehydrogenase / 2-oxoglutarate reductase